MDPFITIYPQAIDHTKKKIYEDINRYLENKETMPAFQQFKMERGQFLEQIWVNVWINKVTNAINKREKKAFLFEKGFEVEGVDRKLINQMFRTEIKEYQPFDVLGWLDGIFLNQELKWQEQFEKAKINYKKRIEDEKRAEKKRKAKQELDKLARDFIEKEYMLIYLYIRHYVARHLAMDLESNPKYDITKNYQQENLTVLKEQHCPEDFSVVSDFLWELTGGVKEAFHWGRNNYEYETYYDVYEQLITEYLFEIVPDLLFNKSTDIKNIYNQTFEQPKSGKLLLEIIYDSLIELATDFIADVSKEHLEDLLKLHNVPFDESVHGEILEQDIRNQEKRKEQELAEIERKQALELQIIEDVFGQEYSPNVGRNLRFVLHIGETNTGKTHRALAKMMEAESGLYLAPLRLLALEVFDKLNAEGVPCSLKTGEEEKLVFGARHMSCTVEMFHEKDYVDCIVIDEAQMIADKDRGFSWYKAITKANANEVHIIGSRNIKGMLLQLLGDSQIELHEYSREIPLEVEKREFSLSNTKKGDALVCFSRRKVLETAAKLQSKGHKVSMIYGSMPPETRKKQMQLFITGKTTTIVSTDAIGMGLNLPIRRIVFLENEKFDGTKRRRLTSQEVKQIAGRAGRKGIYDIGRVAFTSEINRMKRLLHRDDEPQQTFAIAPTNGVFERFQKYYHNLGVFFEFWNKFDSPEGTQKATLAEERELYMLIQGTEIEARLSMMDLYGFLHLPFSSREQGLKDQWRNTISALIEGSELPEPKIKKETLEDLELTYKAIGLHLLFLYRLEKRTEAHYWERLREEISDDVHENLKKEVKNYQNKCKRCGKKLPLDFQFPICNSCHSSRYRRDFNEFLY